MHKLISLIKATMTEDMNIFKINTKKSSKFTKVFLPIILSLVIMGLMFYYSNMFMEGLQPVKMEFVLLTIFIMLTSILTLVEGIYKSSNLLFNCKDDDLLLSLPLKRSTVLFIRVFKFYVFELMYNSLFLLPAMIVYAKYTNPEFIYYLISVIGLLLFPIIPILLSCIIGLIISFISTKFKGKSYVQTVITMIFLLGMMYLSYNINNLITNIAKNATSINDFITKLYYPAGIYIELITNYSFIKLIEFIIIHLGLFIITILLIGKIYFNINSSVKSIKTKKNKKNYIIKTNTPMKSLIKKELNRFINSTVFVTNAGFGLVLFVVACILITIKFDSLSDMLIQNNIDFDINTIKNYMPVIAFGLICFGSLMTSITSSMISLEGKSFNILKSLPIKPFVIVQSKVLTAIIIMIPFIIIGDLIIFIKFNFDILSIILLLIASIILPLISETIGIIVNLKYPRMDAKNDTEVVKQSMSSMVSVFTGMGLLGISIFLIYKAIETNLNNHLILLIFISIYTIIYMILNIYLHKTCESSFNNIVV